MNPTKIVTPSANGRRRPQLADSISRLDSILDGLSDAIPATVAQSIQEALASAVKEAVQVALNEALNNPDLLAALAARLPVQQPSPSAPEPTTTPVQAVPVQATETKGLRARWERVVQWVGERLSAARLWCWRLGRRLPGIAAGAWEVRSTLSIGLATGVSVGVLAYCMGPLMASVLCGLAATTITTASILLVPVLRLLCLAGHGDE